MILDYSFNKTKRVLSVSYVKENGMKDILNFNVDRFKTYYSTPSGKYLNWDGSKCDVKWTDNPDKFDIKTYMEELNPKYKEKIKGTTSPKLYTWDIEVVSDEFPTASEAKYPIVTISVCSPDCNVIVLGTKNLGTNGEEYLNDNFSNYISKLEYFKKLGLPNPSIKYLKFQTEKDMLIYFLKNIVAKVPVLAGWNSMLFDWQYVQNRIKGYYPDVNLNISSCNNSMDYKNYTDMMGNKVKLSLPQHTVLLDMMAVIEQDYVVLPIKESMTLDYIAYESLGVNKIEHEQSLYDLYFEDYKKYVFYNAIDSVLVQMIDKRFKTLQNIYTQALYCREKIGLAFSKIAVSEALVFNYFYDNGIKVIPDRDKDVHRGTLTGAYVRVPTPGKHKYVCCNDFASLYPSTIITCNLSFENFMGNEFTEEELEKYRKDPNYFVSVMGSVYKNDKDYAFKVIQATLKANRNTFKYLAKGLYADVMSDVDNIIKKHSVINQHYKDEYVKAIAEIGYSIKSTKDLQSIDLNEFKPKLATLIEFYTSYEQAMKLLGNSMYGGSSHISFFWFNMALANDITGEARNVIHLMENHIPEYIRNEWPNMKDVHKELGITVDFEKAEMILKESGKKSFVDVIYGDSCDGKTLISTSIGDIKIEDLFNDSDVVFIDRDKEFALSDIIIKNYNGSEIINSNIKYVIRHKTNKSKWEIIDSHNNSVIVTGDHSMIIWDGEMKEIKPSEMKIGMTLITTNGFTTVASIKNIGNFENEYVYDIEVKTENDNEHNFFGGNILIHNTDSVKGDTVIHTEKGDKTIEEMFNENYNNNLFHTHKGHELVSTSDKVLNYNNNNELEYGKVNYIMRHKVTKPKWRLKTKSGKEVIVTNDHSMIVFRNGQKLEVKPYEILPTDKILVVNVNCFTDFEYIFDEIEICECIGMFEEEYVYDIEMDDESHTFIANDILVHNSLYISYENFVKTIKGHEKMTPEEKGKIVVDFNTKYLDAHNREFMNEHYKNRNVKSVQNFELETLALSGVWLDVKKRYAQVLLWKDGKTYSVKDGLPMKAKGLELIKAAYPKQSREGLQRLVRYLLEDDEDNQYLLHRLNAKMQEEKQLYYNADIDDICASMKVNNYNKYIICDNNKTSLVVAPKCPANVKAAGNYNRIRQIYNLPGNPIYGGKIKYFEYYPVGTVKRGNTEYFGYQAKNYPKWADKYAPIAKDIMFQKFTLAPFNRIIEAVGIGTLNIDGSIQMGLLF